MERIEEFGKFIKKFKDEINNSNTIILTAHRDPDGDAIGSVLAMQEALQNIGKDAEIVLDEMPKVFLELKNTDKIITIGEFEKSNKKYDLAIFLDNNSKSNFLISDNILEKSKKILNSVSDKIENLVDLLEDKINYPEEFEFKDRYDFSNIKNGLKKFIEISYKILMYLTIFSICCILIPMILITIYQFLIYFIALLATILEVLIAIIRQIKI